MSVRVRFAPSPTGALHIGGVRTALYNYLFAKQHKGQFILRIEDTDQTRFVPEAEQYIVESLKWLGITPDEGQGFGGAFSPYRQSERKEIYQQYIKELINNGKAYYAFDTPEELEAIRTEYETTKKVFSYDMHTRNSLKNSLTLSAEEVKTKLAAGEKYVIRFKIPENIQLELTDCIRGKIKVNTTTLDDKVLFKSDGMPTYHFANIVDDHLMQISHVIRGEEWLPSMPLHVLLYQAFGWDVPEFAHLPLILKPTGKGKLSKRDGVEGGFPVFPLQWQESIGYKEAGYLPEAVINMLALLGWNPGTEQEIFSLDELIQQFDLGKVNKSGARFDIKKAMWFNQNYLQNQPNEQLMPLLINEFKEQTYSTQELLHIISLVKERASFPQDIVSQANCFFIAPQSFDEKAANKLLNDENINYLGQLNTFLKQENDFSVEKLTTNIKQWITDQEIPMGKIMQVLRLALVGDLKGPDLMEIMHLIGKEQTLRRIQNLQASYVG